MRLTPKAALALAMVGVQVIASPVASPAAEPKPQDDVQAQFWHAAHEYSGRNCDGDLIEKHEGAILLDVPLDDRTNSVWLDNGWNQWNGFPSYKKPKGKNWCTGTDYGRLVTGRTGCYDLWSHDPNEKIQCIGWLLDDPQTGDFAERIPRA